jgi:hypothetical protein
VALATDATTLAHGLADRKPPRPDRRAGARRGRRGRALRGTLPRRSPMTGAGPREDAPPDPYAAVPGRVIDGLRSM